MLMGGGGGVKKGVLIKTDADGEQAPSQMFDRNLHTP